MKSPERVRRRSPGRDDGRECDRCGGRDRDHDRYNISRDECGKERERERERRRRRELERYEEDKREKRKRRELERDAEEKREMDREKRKHRELEWDKENDREREKRRLRQLEQHEEEKKRKKIQEDEEMSKHEKWGKRWQQPADREKGNTSTVPGIQAAPLVDTPIAAVLRQFPNLGSSETPSIQAGEQPTKCLILKNVFDPNLASKLGSRYYKCIRDDVHQRCGMYGAVHHIHIDEDRGFVYMKFDTSRSASTAKENLHEKPYKDRKITASFMDTRKYDSRFGTLGR